MPFLEIAVVFPFEDSFSLPLTNFYSVIQGETFPKPFYNVQPENSPLDHNT